MMTGSKRKQNEQEDKKTKRLRIEEETNINEQEISSLSPSIKKSKSPIAAAISARGKFGKPKSTLGQLAASLSKKPKKLNTLEKSKIDWKQYVDQEGIVDELKYHNKNGYIEKQEFLQRTYDAQNSEIKALRKGSRMN
ncbi:BCNT-domain-containing protein [Gigaspora margarita]|uniref:SWR1-complex protein 5 n=1 Tax=Gigaspora margarita TaxID=4874 RepID=A0A8H4ES64_GIGMA|nr:BCNT-domain-containing protein [Gigaspora margarita]